MKNFQKNNSRLGWTFQEQAIVKDLYESKGVQSWVQIASFLSNQVNGIKRTSKQCRERYNNYIKLHSQSSEFQWTDEQNARLFNIYVEKGSRQAQIAKQFPGRSENWLKNKFYGSIRKVMNTINRLCIQRKNKIRPIKYTTLANILQIKEAVQQNKDEKYFQKFEFCQKIRIDLTMAAKKPQQITIQIAQNIIQRARRFNILTRFQNMVRNRKFLKVNSQSKFKNSIVEIIQANSFQNQNIFGQQKFSLLKQYEQNNNPTLQKTILFNLIKILWYYINSIISMIQIFLISIKIYLNNQGPNNQTFLSDKVTIDNKQ